MSKKSLAFFKEVEKNLTKTRKKVSELVIEVAIMLVCHLSSQQVIFRPTDKLFNIYTYWKKHF